MRFDQNSQNPYGIQTSASLEFQPFKDSLLSITGIHLRGVHLGSFYNVNQPDPSGTVQVFNSKGQAELQERLFRFRERSESRRTNPPPDCAGGSNINYPAQMIIPGVPHVNGDSGLPRSAVQRFLRSTLEMGFRLRRPARQYEQADDEQLLV